MKVPFLKLSLIVAILTLAVSNAHAEAKPVDEFTSTAEKKAKVLERGDDSFRFRCPGVAGYSVIFEGAHGRSWINLEYDGEITDLMDAILNACPGDFPSKTNDVVQWRGTKQDGKFVPYACIFRMTSLLDGKQVETLVILQLAGAGSRVVGQVPASKGNAAAEALADKLCKVE